MIKTRLNFPQIIGLGLVLLGELVKNYYEYDQAYWLILFGLGVFLMASQLNKGIAVSVFLYFAGNVANLLYDFEMINLLKVLGVFGFTVAGFYQFVYQLKEKDLAFIYYSIVIFLLGSLQLEWTWGIVMLITGLTGVLLGYSYRFFNKLEKTYEDYLKLLIIYNIIVLYLLTILRLPGASQLMTLMYFLIFIWMLLYLLREIKILIKRK